MAHHSDRKIFDRLVIIDIDGLRRDAFYHALEEGSLTNFERILGGLDSANAYHIDAVSTAPSITFTAQASIITGEHPRMHGIAGNESFDRFGRISDGKPRHFGFDVGDTLAVDDAIAVFSSGLASKFLKVPTLYEQVGVSHPISAVFYHMYARGAQHWMPPSIVDIARFTKGRGILGMEAGKYDAGMLRQVIKTLQRGISPDVMMVYFMGLDHHSHLHGPNHQSDYLTSIIDPQVGILLNVLEQYHLFSNTLFIIVSDHGQIAAIPDDRHALQLGFPFDLELAHIFTALGLDVHDKPGEDPNCDAVMGLNGGMAHVYLQNKNGKWSDRPRFRQDVVPVAQAFHKMNTEGEYAEELYNTLDLILVRDVEHEGWHAPYRVYKDEHTQIPLDISAALKAKAYVDPVNRINAATSEVSGDLILIAKGKEGFYFGAPTKGVHGGLLPGESDPILTFAVPDADISRIEQMRDIVSNTIKDCVAADNNRLPSIADMVPVLHNLITVKNVRSDVNGTINEDI